MEQRLEELKNRLAEISDLGKATALLGWDQRVFMPPAGGAVRAEQMATLSRIIHERFTDPEVGRLLDELTPYGESLPYDSDDASLIRTTSADYEKAVRVPGDLRVELSRAASLGYDAWHEARATDNFELLRPFLERNIELRHRYIECFAPYDDPYDPLLDDYERGMKTTEVAAVFDQLKPALKQIVADVADRGPVDTSFLDGSFPAEEQKRFALHVLEALGFDRTAWRFDETAHPFASGMGIDDIRLTGRYDVAHFGDGLFAAMHEFGHGAYEHGVDKALERTPLARGVSMALHESQSRLWENLVGRSQPFWLHFFPQLQDAFPAFRSVDETAFYRAINAVRPSLIRVEADQVTYSLHIILRFELEREMIGGLDLRELPAIWNERMADYLGIDVPDDAHGVLQDVHWGSGGLGYFPTYALGNVVSLQIWERVSADIPDLDEQFARGEFEQLMTWLREHLYRYGRKFTPTETLERATGTGLDPAPYLRYLHRKVEEIYGTADTSSAPAAAR
jgi:carboxypeptidase Taq